MKAAKLLSDTSVPAFYPILFVLVTDIMDTIGRLVFDRIRHKAGGYLNNKHSTDGLDIQYPPRPARVCVSLRPEGALR
jgi:hypothetical protein